MTEPVLALDRLTVRFGSRRVVEDLTLRIGPGEVLGLAGESGSGKSTAALAIMGDLGPGGRIETGSLRFEGRELRDLAERQWRALRGAGIALVGQEPMAALNPSMRIGAQLAEVPRLHGRVSRAEARAAARRALEELRLPDPDRLLAAYPHQLSGGQLQRVVLAMALMAEPRLLILDEPTTALDVTVEAEIMALLREIRRTRGTAMLFIGHDLALMAGICDRLAVLYAGRLVEAGPVSRIFEKARHPYTQALLAALPRIDAARRPPAPLAGSQPLPQDRPPGCAFAPRCAHVRPGLCDRDPVPLETVTPDAAVRCLRWREIDGSSEAAPTLPAPEIGGPILEVEGLTRRFGTARGTVHALEEATFTAQEGETLAIVGESGCGKSTLARLLMGLERADAGTIRLKGVEVQDRPAGRRPHDLTAAMQMVFQNPADTLNPAIPAGRQVMRALELFQGGLSAPTLGARLTDLLNLVRLSPALGSRMPRALSGGQRQRMGIARALAGDPAVLVADEPVSALDASVQAAVIGTLLELKRTRRATLLFISHDLALVRQIADRVMVLYLGRIMEIGPADRIFGALCHPYTRALLDAAPRPDPRAPPPTPLTGERPSALTPPSGCPFHSRCPRRAEVPGTLCEEGLPPLAEVAPGHRIRCHLPPERLRS
ncbi:dipeptide ABC transporter ATP-binding protein [Rhodobacter sphaeroides]|uniref:dipeptide ABC transporter ATP-binding protein n=1 Tax=Cereibacter sphaeroides TaxID=1063 RepID=UPI00132A69F6|nr:ABC transporter ATP-binding protein [Cereibacter sphaeroides]MWP36617.1 dipeptide ABC transporter ATP-binding protein [Cereibacter sphaeroides]